MAASWYSFVSLGAKTDPVVNPFASNSTSVIIAVSGMTMAIGRKSIFKFSGSSKRPAYPGFMVTKAAQEDTMLISLLSNMNLEHKLSLAALMVTSC